MKSSDQGPSRLLVINGYSLAIPGQGIGVYTVRLLRGLLRNLPLSRIRVAVPDIMRHHAAWLPPEVVEIVQDHHRAEETNFSMTFTGPPGWARI